MTEESGDQNHSLSEASDGEYDPHYTPIITLPEVTLPTHEEDEDVVFKVRAKLYRFDSHEDVPEWKERGTGELKMLKHSVNKTIRIVMRRDKTLKLCANHFITPLMDLKEKKGNDRAFVYNVLADFVDEEIKSECLAIKFGTPLLAEQFKKHFLESQEWVKKECKLYNGSKLESSDEDDSSTEDDKKEPVVAEVNDKEDEETKDVIKKMTDLKVEKDV